MMFTKQEIVTSSGVAVHTLEVWIEREWLMPATSAGGPMFSDRDAARVRFIQDLVTQLGVNDEGVEVVLHLVDQLHGMRRAMDDLRATMDAAIST